MENNFLQSELTPHKKAIAARRSVIKSFKAKENAKRSPAEKFADLLTAHFGTVTFLAINALWFLTWIVINTNLIPGIKAFDPFPFGLLTMVVSLEAIFLAIIVLISQNREARIAELREEIELQLNTMSEGEVTKLIKMMAILLEKQGVNVEDDPELKRMLKPFDSEVVEKEIQNELDI
jgi:uncharacterized membrane protein